MFYKVLLVDDDHDVLKDVPELLEGTNSELYQIKKVDTGDFQEGMILLKANEYDLVILDLCKGDPSPESEKIGEEILAEIRSLAFIPVIFFTGLPAYVKDQVSQIIRVASKGDGIDSLLEEMAVIAKSGILPLKRQIFNITQDTLRYFFWDFVHPQKEMIDKIKDEVSLGYLLLRRLSHSLSKDRIRELLKDERINEGLAHPMEFYIYPILSGEYEVGEILEKDENIYAILTPSCDFVQANNRPRKAENVLLAMATPLAKTQEYKKYVGNPSKYKESISQLIQSRKSDRYFFLPGTPFIQDCVIDFQKKVMIEYNKLDVFNRVAKLDDPFAQSMISAFTRYYNRIGFPDIDTDYVLSKFDSSHRGE